MAASFPQTRIGAMDDIPGVLALQETYLYDRMNEEGRRRGFVTTPFTGEQVGEVIRQNGLFVATDVGGTIVAYAFAASWGYFQQWAIFGHMTSRFSELSFRGQAITTENSFQYGPVCIDIPFRGTGLLNRLFEEMRLAFVKRYPISITFINRVNKVSEQAHVRKLGWEVIDRFGFNGKEYLGLAFDMGRSVLGRAHIGG